jgi:hypothetical protein
MWRFSSTKKTAFEKEIPVTAKSNKTLKTLALFLCVIVILACSTVTAPQGSDSDPAAIETRIALGIMATNVANQQITLEAIQSGMTQQAAPPQPTVTQESFIPPTQNLIPPPKPADTAAAPLPLVTDIFKSVDTFYCYQAPYEVTITVKVSNIERGMAVYYHIRDKNSGVRSDGQVVDLHRKGSDARSATIIGGGSNKQNLQFPPLMGESYFVYQIISDDGTFRSPTYTDITFYPCAQ